MVYMKKFICSLASSVIAFSAHAVWLPSERDAYFDTMLESSLTNQTYVKVLDIAGTIEVVIVNIMNIFTLMICGYLFGMRATKQHLMNFTVYNICVSKKLCTHKNK